MSRIHHNTRHGHWINGKPTRTYRIWRSMIGRCIYPDAAGYEHYGGRGISVCERWRVFDNFLADIGEIPDGMTLDRIVTDGDYEPGNVRLATPKQQARNRRNNLTATICGETKTVAEWAEEFNLPYMTLYNRIKRGWPEDQLLLPAYATKNVFLTINGETKTISQWATITGLRKDVISKRKKAGWSDADCIKPSNRPYRFKPSP